MAVWQVYVYAWNYWYECDAAFAALCVALGDPVRLIDADEKE